MSKMSELHDLLYNNHYARDKYGYPEFIKTSQPNEIFVVMEYHFGSKTNKNLEVYSNYEAAEAMRDHLIQSANKAREVNTVYYIQSYTVKD